MRPASRSGRAESGRARWRLPSQVTNMQKSIDFASFQMVSTASASERVPSLSAMLASVVDRAGCETTGSCGKGSVPRARCAAHAVGVSAASGAHIRAMRSAIVRR